MKRNQNSDIFAGFLLLLALTGCSKHEEPPAVPQPKVAQQQKPAVKPAVPVQKQLSSAVNAPPSLDFSRRADPFKPAVQAVVATPAPTGRPSVRSTSDLLPIQSFEVTKFKVAGIIAGLKENRALVIDPNGKGYVVRVGTLIGSNNGRIARITSSSIEVVESIRTEKGRVKKVKTVLTLAKKR